MRVGGPKVCVRREFAIKCIAKTKYTHVLLELLYNSTLRIVNTLSEIKMHKNALFLTRFVPFNKFRVRKLCNLSNCL